MLDSRIRIWGDRQRSEILEVNPTATIAQHRNLTPLFPAVGQRGAYPMNLGKLTAGDSKITVRDGFIFTMGEGKQSVPGDGVPSLHRKAEILTLAGHLEAAAHLLATAGNWPAERHPVLQIR